MRVALFVFLGLFSIAAGAQSLTGKVSSAAEGAMEGVLVQPMVSGGVEVMVGVTYDPLFGPLIAFGLGGIHVEILGDVRSYYVESLLRK